MHVILAPVTERGRNDAESDRDNRGARILGAAATGASAANSKASCNGILVSSLAGQPGIVADLTREFHDLFKEAGIPPGFFDAAGAHEHAGSVEGCLGP